MNYFIDTEFCEDFTRPLIGKREHTIDLISIGIVAADGRKYYAISRDFDVKRAWSNEWLRENVLRPIYDELFSQLSGQQKYFFPLLDAPFGYRALKRLIRFKGKMKEQIAEDIIEFVHLPFKNMWLAQQGENLSFGRYIENVAQPINFYGYFCDYDWVVFCSLFGRMIDLPIGFPMYCKDLKQILDERIILLAAQKIMENYSNTYSSKLFKEVLDAYKEQNDYPKQDEGKEHNALEDALWNKRLYDHLGSNKAILLDMKNTNDVIPNTTGTQDY